MQLNLKRFGAQASTGPPEMTFTDVIVRTNEGNSNFYKIHQ